MAVSEPLITRQVLKIWLDTEERQYQVLERVRAHRRRVFLQYFVIDFVVATVAALEMSLLI